MSIGFVYVIAFGDDKRFLMVKHRHRAWEMPGGRLEPGESPEDCARREFLEETGMTVELFEKTYPVEGGLVFYGRVGEKKGEPNGDEISETAFFSELPAELSFPKVEYEKMLEVASELLL